MCTVLLPPGGNQIAVKYNMSYTQNFQKHLIFLFFIYLFTYALTYLFIYLLTYLLIYLLTYLFIYLFI